MSVRSPIDAARAGVAFLASRQRDDGAFLDYDLEPGPSDSWTTGVAAVALIDAARTFHDDRAAGCARRAAEWLAAVARPDGWGYNLHVRVDADSTAFCIRATRAHDLLDESAGARLLAPYVDEDGAVHTYAQADLGRWGDAHDCVAGSVALALAVCGGGEAHGRVVAFLLDRQRQDPAWRPFWWLRPWYAAALNAAALQRSHAREPVQVRQRLRQAVRRMRGDLSVLDLAAIATCLAPGELARRALTRVLELQQPDGGFPASRVLIVPHAYATSGYDGPFTDVRRVFTTAACLVALARHARIGAAEVAS